MYLAGSIASSEQNKKIESMREYVLSSSVRSCSISGDGIYLAVGNPLDDSGGTDVGEVKVWKKSDGIWTIQQVLKPLTLTGTLPPQFGYSCAFNSDGTYLVVGAPFSDAGGSTDSGIAEVWTRGTTGTMWTRQQVLYAKTGGSLQQFGYSCSINSDGTY